ncbi:hypothetical protein EDD17DRAFT_1524269 [Pisolithus thermaeus]|nr:hypothetical protein EDD17DRAFT_1524269 [Pisolithus thermaeus]
MLCCVLATCQLAQALAVVIPLTVGSWDCMDESRKLKAYGATSALWCRSQSNTWDKRTRTNRLLNYGFRRTLYLQPCQRPIVTSDTPHIYYHLRNHRLLLHQYRYLEIFLPPQKPLGKVNLYTSKVPPPEYSTASNVRS